MPVQMSIWSPLLTSRNERRHQRDASRSSRFVDHWWGALATDVSVEHDQLRVFYNVFGRPYLGNSVPRKRLYTRLL